MKHLCWKKEDHWGEGGWGKGSWGKGAWKKVKLRKDQWPKRIRLVGHLKEGFGCKENKNTCVYIYNG